MARVVHLSAVHRAEDPRLFHRECATLHDAGFDVHLVIPHARNETRDGIRIHALPQVRGRYRRFMLWPLLYRKARALRADVYHFHDPEVIPAAYVLKRATGARMIYDMHEDYRAGRGLEGFLLRALERWCFRWVDHVVISDAVYAEITDPSPVPTTLIANYFKPPDASIEFPTRASGEPFTLAYTGVMSKDRGLFNLLDLACAIQQARLDWRIELTGICYVDCYRKRADRVIGCQGLEGVVKRTGWNRYVPWPKLLARCTEAHVGLVLWNARSGQMRKIPTKFYEYLHCGLPILCSDFPLWRQFVKKHECGAVVPPGDVRVALQMLRRWAETPDLYQRLSKAAQEAALKYRWQPMGERLIRLYRQLLAQ